MIDQSSIRNRVNLLAKNSGMAQAISAPPVVQDVVAFVNKPKIGRAHV